MTYAQEMARIKKREQLTQVDTDEWYSWLRDSGTGLLGLYGCSHAELTVKLHSTSMEDIVLVMACIGSIDDTGCTLTGPFEPTAKARRRLQRLLTHIRAWEGRLPTLEAFEHTASNCGLMPERY